MSTNKEKNNVVLFNINGFNEPENYPSQKDSDIFNTTFKISNIIKRGTTTQGHDISNIKNFIESIWEEVEKQGGQPVVNIHYNNNILPSFDNKAVSSLIEQLKNTEIKVCLSFNHYDAEFEAKKLPSLWKPLFARVDQVFFADAIDREAAIEKGHIATDKATSIQSISTSLNSEVKKLPPGDRLTVVNLPLDNADVITDLIMTKFNIASDNAKDKENLKAGILIEVNEILQSNDKVPEKLGQYISVISRQFEKDRSIDQDRTISNTRGIYQENPIDIYFSVPPNQQQNTYNMQQKLHEIQQENALRLEAVLNRTVAAPAIQNSLPNAPIHQPVLELESINNLTDPKHLYRDYEISNIIRRFIDEQKVSVVDYASLTNPDLLNETIIHSVQELQNRTKEAVLIPLNTGHEHWLSLAFKCDENNNIQCIYNDSTGHPISDRSELMQIITGFVPVESILDLKTLQQQNAQDCGSFVVDNLIKIAKGEQILTEEQSKGTMGTELRQQHHAVNQKQLEKQETKAASSPSIGVVEHIKQNQQNGFCTTPSIRKTPSFQQGSGRGR
ncbi:Ulp1 family isopeptidase [Candidatus Tisiphia endosymbiont of Nemotelus uliginosus]|uniref:Ulp1 family isopeptidase n=1 Tax=Candidatus Tisiphia endosymbiont of Nemotelus uliginosus TaxID=3077926 RepID=UPI0035C8FBAF